MSSISPQFRVTASRPYMPGYAMMFRKDVGQLDWSWAADRLSKAHNYWLTTIRPDGRPHVMPIWGVWMDNAFYFSTGRQSCKSRNLEENNNCVVCPENAAKAVILEGIAKEELDPALRKRFTEVYKEKYNWEMEGNDGPVYSVQPRTAFGFIENSDKVQGNHTHWVFD